jgi:hypothetical protein
MTLLGKEAVARDIEAASAPLLADSDSDATENATNKLHIVSLHDFIEMKLPERDKILAPWMMTQSLNMIHGWRGVGKTHVSLGISYAIACGSRFLNWKAEKPRRVLLVDGEMPAAALQERLTAIIASTGVEPEPGFLSIITPDLQTGAMPDLSTYNGQDVISEAAERVKAELIVLDNLSCLVRGEGRENDSESWVRVQEWALLQRQKGRSVQFIHHSGKNGKQRGTSKREDLLDVVISLKRPPDYDPATGASFEIHYEKARHLSGTDVDPVEAQLTVNSDGQSTWVLRNVSDTTFDRVISLANEGLNQREIAVELEVHRSTVSRAWRKADAKGLLSNKNSAKGANQYKKASKGE